MQVFLSYSHADVQFARSLTAALRDAGVSMWMDEERMTGGSSNQKQITAAAMQSAHAIFLVSPSWLVSDWTLKELSLFESRTECRRIAVLLSARSEIHDELPPGLTHVSHIEWLAETDPDAGLWQVYCAIRNEAPGPHREWRERGRGLRKDDHIPAPPLPPPASSSPPSVFCNREQQWSMLDPLSTEHRHHVIFLPGPRGEAHDVFVRRIELRLQSATVRRVSWAWRGTQGAEGRPASEAEFREAMAHALNVHPNALAAKLRVLLARQNLFLVHERISDDFEDPELVNYYTRYLPALVDEAAPTMSLKCVQGIEWIDRRWYRHLLDGLIGRSLPSDARQARQLMLAIKSQMPDSFKVTSLPELVRITQKDIQGLCETYGLTPSDISRLLARISAGARTSEEMLNILDDSLRERRQQRPKRNAA